jgi:hypothetical protein
LLAPHNQRVMVVLVALGSGARYRVRTCDPYRVKVVLYH